MLFSAFFLDGTSEFLRLIPGNAGFSEAVLSWRLPLSAPVGMIIWMTYALFKHFLALNKIWKISILYSVLTALAQVCYFLAVDNADRLGLTSIVYPVSVGSSIVLFALYCVFFRKEKFNFAAWCGVAAATTGITLLSSL